MLWYYGKADGQRIIRRKRLYTCREAGVMLRHSSKWIRRQIREGRMSAVKLGNAYFIHSMEITRWMGLLPRASARIGKVIRGREIPSPTKEVPEKADRSQVPGLQSGDRKGVVHAAPRPRKNRVLVPGVFYGVRKKDRNPRGSRWRQD